MTPFGSWDEVAAFALALPDTELSTSYGRPAVKVRGKAFVYPGREKGSFAVATPLGEKELLMENESVRAAPQPAVVPGARRPTHPDTFWETPHYRGWPAVLVRFGSADRERIETLIARAWWDRASKAQRMAHGGERP